MDAIGIVICVDAIFGFFLIAMCIFLISSILQHREMLEVAPVRIIRIPSWTELREESITICTNNIIIV